MGGLIVHTTCKERLDSFSLNHEWKPTEQLLIGFLIGLFWEAKPFMSIHPKVIHITSHKDLYFPPVVELWHTPTKDI
jgi:hypothetical protein